MKNPRSINPVELEQLRAGVDRAWLNFMAGFYVHERKRRLLKASVQIQGRKPRRSRAFICEMGGGFRILTPFAPLDESKIAAIQAAQELCRVACSHASKDIDRLFFRVFVGRLAPDGTEYCEMESKAKTSQRKEFFLSRAAFCDYASFIPFEHPGANGLQRLLLQYWDRPGVVPGCEELCRLGRAQIANACNKRLRRKGKNCYSSEAVEKARQRLKLATIFEVREKQTTKVNFGLARRGLAGLAA